MEKYFYATTIVNKYGLLHTISIIYMGLFFIMMLCMNITNARIKYAMLQKMRINTDLAPGEGLRILGPPSWTSKSFNLLIYLPPEMVSPVVLLHEFLSL